jgi:hypothetical protein
MASDDIRRELEQRALRNVRGLVDKVENQDLADRQSARRMLVRFAIGIALVVALVAGYLALRAHSPAPGITIESKKG